MEDLVRLREERRDPYNENRSRGVRSQAQAGTQKRWQSGPKAGIPLDIEERK